MSETAPAPLLSVSTWSLHRVLGWTYFAPPGQPVQPAPRFGEGTMKLLDIPARIAKQGIARLEICHFHLPTRDATYLGELRAALEEAGVELLTVLVDDGDLLDPHQAEVHLAWTADWVQTAAALGAKRVRVIAGRAAFSAETLAQSQAALRQLVALGDAVGVRIITENWFPFLSTPQAVWALLDGLEGRVGLNWDFGNWDDHADKYADLARIAPLAESAHAKCRFDAAFTPDRADFTRCLELAQSADFYGPFTLIYDGPNDDEWEGVRREQEIVLSHFA